MSDPVADAVRGILDGHIVMSRELAEKSHFPAIDILQSLSRLAIEVAPTHVLKSAAVIRELLAAHREAADLIQVGAYQQGSDQRVEMALRLNSEINGFLRQDMGEMTHLAETYTRLQELAKQAEGGTKR